VDAAEGDEREACGPLRSLGRGTRRQCLLLRRPIARAPTFNFEQGAAPSSIFSDQKRGKREADTEAVDQLLVFNTTESAWSELESEGAPPCARYKHGACLVPERRGAARMLIFGGQDEEGVALNDQHVLNL